LVSGLNSKQKKAKSKVVKLPTQYAIPGKGRKKCGGVGCSAYVGVRCLECDSCGYEFPVAEKKEKVVDHTFDDVPITDEDKRYARAIGCGQGGRIVHVGSGHPPAFLNGTDKVSVDKFCYETAFSGLSDKKIYMPSAMKNWVGCTLERSGDDYKEVAALIDLWYDERVATSLASE
jgi:hypothetical protein